LDKVRVRVRVVVTVMVRVTVVVSVMVKAMVRVRVRIRTRVTVVVRVRVKASVNIHHITRSTTVAILYNKTNRHTNNILLCRRYHHKRLNTAPAVHDGVVLCVRRIPEDGVAVSTSERG
jgi:hypothetical protein